MDVDDILDLAVKSLMRQNLLAHLVNNMNDTTCRREPTRPGSHQDSPLGRYVSLSGDVHHSDIPGTVPGQLIQHGVHLLT